jgi:hypothetical protein
MGSGRVIEIELMPSLVGDDTETVCSKLKNWNRFLKPNFEPLPKLRQVRRVRCSRIKGLILSNSVF